jgi:Tfp pilus assembly protein PilF
VEPPKPAVGSLVGRGTELYLAGKLQPAREAFEAAIAADPSSAAAHRGLGIVYQRSGAAALAIAAYRRYLELRPNAQDIAAIQDRIDQLGGAR